MLYMGYLIIVGGQNIVKKVSEISSFEQLRLKSAQAGVHESLRRTPSPFLAHHGLVHIESLKHALHGIFDHCRWSQYRKIRLQLNKKSVLKNSRFEWLRLNA